MMRGLGEYQKTAKNTTRNKILTTLLSNEIGMSFKELEQTTNLSPRTLTKGLKSLQSENIIEKRRTSTLENLDIPEVMDDVMGEYRKIILRLNRNDFLTKRVKNIKRIALEKRHDKKSHAHTSRILQSEKISKIYFEHPEDITKRQENNMGFVKWLKGFYKHTKKPKEIRQFVNFLSKQKTVYSFVKPKARLAD